LSASEGLFDQSQTTIDNEHLVQLGLIDAVIDAVVKASPSVEIDQVLTQFINYTELHFLSEQMLMRLHAYPSYDEHVSDHDAMIDRMRAVRNNINADESTLAIDTAQRLKGELLSHIRNRDAALHAFLAQRDPVDG